MCGESFPECPATTIPHPAAHLPAHHPLHPLHPLSMIPPPHPVPLLHSGFTSQLPAAPSHADTHSHTQPTDCHRRTVGRSPLKVLKKLERLKSQISAFKMSTNANRCGGKQSVCRIIFLRGLFHFIYSYIICLSLLLMRLHVSCILVLQLVELELILMIQCIN